MTAIVAIAVIQLAALALWWVHTSHAQALALGAGAVELALGLRLAVLAAQRRELCLELLIAGRGGLPLTAVTRELRRLRDRHTQAMLAASLDDLAAEQRYRERQRPICAQRVLAAVRPQLADLAERLRAGDVDVRGVAVIDRLVTCGTSPLYGEEVAPLRDELARARYLLA